MLAMSPRGIATTLPSAAGSRFPTAHARKGFPASVPVQCNAPNFFTQLAAGTSKPEGVWGIGIGFKIRYKRPGLLKVLDNANDKG